MIPWHRADEVLDDLALHIDPCRDGLGLLAWQLGQEPLEVEVHGGGPRTQAPADRARRTHRDDRASDGRCQGTRDNRSTMLLVAVPRQVSSFRLLTLSCRYGMLWGSDCNNSTLRDVIGVKRGDTVGLVGSTSTRVRIWVT